jgi:hypothetical protein
MFGQAASLVVSTSPRLDRWADAFTDWLESIAAARGRGAYLQALSYYSVKDLFGTHILITCPLRTQAD